MRHLTECVSVLSAAKGRKPGQKVEPVKLSEVHSRLLEAALDPKAHLGDRLHPFLHVRARRDAGDLFVVPLVDGGSDSLATRLKVPDDVDALLVTWSPTEKKRSPKEAPSFMFVTDERDWRLVIVLSYTASASPGEQTVMGYELEMQRLGFFSGQVSALITSTGSLERVATKDVYPSPPSQTLAASGRGRVG
jgi:hypothetical protein